jgi:hypothetical protein
MSNALRTPGFPATQVIGGELQGKGVAPTGADNAGTVVTPNGKAVTPAVNAIAIPGPNKR